MARRREELPEGETGRPAARGGAVDYDMLNDIIGFALRRAQFLVYQDYARSVGELDLRPPQFAAMVIINANSGMSQTALANSMGIDRSAAVILIDALEKRGLAVRVPSTVDRRTHSILLTPDGEALLAKLKAVVAEHDARITAPLSADERETLVSLLRRIYER